MLVTMSSRHSPAVQRLLGQLSATPVTWLLASACVAALAWVEAHGASTDAATLVRAGALERGRLSAGQPWRLLTAAFLHVGWVHLAWNLAAGVPLCRRLERFVGPARFLSIYLASAVGASAVSALGQDVVSAGASGALFGVIGATLALHRRALGSWRAFLASRPARFVLVSILLFGVLGDLLLPLDQLAHAGGFAAGAALAWLLSAPRPAPRGGWAVLAAALAALAVAASWPRPSLSRFAAHELERELGEALRARDVAAARGLAARAEAGGDASERLRFYRALLRVQEDDLAGALSAIRTLRGAGDPALRAEAADLERSLARTLAYRHHTGDGARRDPALALSYMEAACALGDEQSCRDARAASPR
jgi:membrane associated rhomboid family serine protease